MRSSLTRIQVNKQRPSAGMTTTRGAMARMGELEPWNPLFDAIAAGTRLYGSRPTPYTLFVMSTDTPPKKVFRPHKNCGPYPPEMVFTTPKKVVGTPICAYIHWM